MIIATEVARLRLEAFCAYQDRYTHEVRLKLNDWDISDQEAELLIIELQTAGFLNDQRFAVSFVSGKFRIKKWGRIKIKAHLRQKKIPAELIQLALQEIDSESYWETLNYLANKKCRDLKNKDESDWNKRIKIARFLVQKGYENDLIGETLDQIFSEQ